MDNIYMKEMEDAGSNTLSLIADFEGSEEQMMDIEIEQAIPVLPLRNMVLFPGVFLPVAVGRASSLRLVKDAEQNQAILLLLARKKHKQINLSLKIYTKLAALLKSFVHLKCPTKP